MTERAVKKLYRANNGLIGGVCNGIARYFDLDPIIVGLVTVALTILTCGLGVIVYIALWLILPKEPYEWSPVDVSVAKDDVKVKGRKKLTERITRDRISPGLFATIGAGLMALAAITSIIVSSFVGGQFTTNFLAILAIDVGTTRLILPGRDGYTFFSIVEGGSLLALGTLTLLSLTGCIFLSVDLWFFQNWPLLLIFIGLMILSHVFDSKELTAIAVAIITLFFVIGCLFYIGIGPSLHDVGVDPITLEPFISGRGAHV